MDAHNTIQLPRRQFIQLVLKNGERLGEEIKASEDLPDKISALCQEAKDAGVQLDDAAAAENPIVADIRRRLDPLVKKVGDIRANVKLQQQASADAKSVASDPDGPNVRVSTEWTMQVLGLNPKLLN